MTIYIVNHRKGEPCLRIKYLSEKLPLVHTGVRVSIQTAKIFIAKGGTINSGEADKHSQGAGEPLRLDYKLYL